ncbi:MAG: TIGR02444 family protein [Parvibaculum sp.]|uniref:TIGR02444 family protein n=1 Tax=Parvibaculum sp. TaxID=2024848 RepID=UPI003C713BF6
MGKTAEDFWDFSLVLYARPGVEAALLALQDEEGLDVNLILFCLYAGARGRSLEEATLAGMRGIGAGWGQGVVAPLRAARRALKPIAEGDAAAARLRAEVKRLELAAEKEMQLRLDALLAGALPAGAALLPPGRGLAERNLSAWLEGEGRAFAGRCGERFARVLDACFNDD